MPAKNYNTPAEQNIHQELRGKTGEEPVLKQLRRTWNWLEHALRRSDDSIAQHALQWTPQDRTGRR